ncbi:MAG: hypothetical protein GY862_04410 [Gammaproteobacteria bacterium]|nr:hypothetical protein [Gammaproteobacteria bacterium]
MIPAEGSLPLSQAHAACFGVPNDSLASAAFFCGTGGSPRFIGISYSVLRREKHRAIVKLPFDTPAAACFAA